MTVKKQVTKKSVKPRTHRFEKVVVTEGEYLTVNADGSSSMKEVSGKKLNKVVDTFNAMKSKGFSVPAPWKHNFDINAFAKIEEGSNGLLEDSSKNAGFWDKLFTRINEDGKTELVGEIEVPGDPNNPDTPAGKIGTSVKETSIYLRGKHQLTDDSGEILEDVPMHIALVTHPIEPGQKNFELKDSDYSIAMSQLVVDTDLGEIAKLLSDAVGVFIPTNTTLDTLVPTLTVALNQVIKCKKDEMSNEGDGPNTSFETEPLIMSKLTQDQLDALVKSGAINPKTKKPFTLEELASLGEETKVETSDPKENLVMSAMQNAMQDDRRKAYRARINTLVETNRVVEDFATTNLYPKADNYTLEFDGSNIKTPEVETIIMSLEALPAPQSVVTPNDLSDMSAEYLGDSSQDDEKFMDEIVEQMMKGEDTFV